MRAEACAFALALASYALLEAESPAEARLPDPFLAVPQARAPGLLHGKVALRLNHQTIFQQRQVEVPIGELSVTSLYYEANASVGLVPAESLPLDLRVAFDFKFVAGVDFPNTPVTRFGFFGSVEPLGQDRPTLGLGLFTTPTGADHNASYLMLVTGATADAWDLDWALGGTAGYQTSGAGTLTPFGALLMAVSWEPVDRLGLALEYTGFFAEGVASGVLSYTFFDALRLYFAAHINLTTLTPGPHRPTAAAGMVWSY